MYRKIKLYQVFLPSSAAVHQRAGFSLEYMVCGKFCLSLNREEAVRRAGLVALLLKKSL